MDTQAQQSPRKRTRIIMLIIAVLLLGLIAFTLLNRNHTAAKAATNLTGYCVGSSLTTNSSGHCVSDIQTMINYMEHSGLTQCPFEHSAVLAINGTYDSTMAAQVTSIQHWATCYASQEGFTSNIKETGVVDRATWGELCAYGYTDPIRSSTVGATASIAAGKDAGCAQLHS